MARKVKEELKDTTVIQPMAGDDDVVIMVAPAMGGNMPVLPDDKLVMAQVKQGFKDNAKSKEFAGSAVQRVAYGVMVHHERLALSVKELPILSKCITSKEAREVITGHMKEHFIDDLQVTKNDSDQDHANEKLPRRDNTQLLTRGIELASTLAAVFVTHESFNPKIGNFTVGSNYLLAKDTNGNRIGSPQGRLASNASILLDGRPLAALGKTTTGNDRMIMFRASVAHFLSCNKPMKKRPGATKETKGVDLKTVAPDKLATEVSADTLANALRMIIAPNNEPSESRPADYGEVMWNFLNTCALLRDEARDNEAKAQAAIEKAA